MSLAQIQTEISRLTREELRQLEQTVHEALARQPIVESPEMLQQRHKLLDEFLAGDERIELAAFEENQARATPEMLARRREISQKFLSGEWSVDLPSYEEIKAEDRRKDPWNL